MSKAPILATISWASEHHGPTSNQYSRRHEWIFDGGVKVPASSSPDIVPVPLSDSRCVDPEEAFVASISSCHMLWFLALAAKAGFSIRRYQDQAVGHMKSNANGKLTIAQVVLRPSIQWHPAGEPTEDEIRLLHRQAHEECFIANSVNTDITIE